MKSRPRMDRATLKAHYEKCRKLGICSTCEAKLPQKYDVHRLCRSCHRKWRIGIDHNRYRHLSSSPFVVIYYHLKDHYIAAYLIRREHPIFAYISRSGDLLDICSTDNWKGSDGEYAIIPLPFHGSAEELQKLCEKIL